MESENRTLKIEQTKNQGVLICRLAGWLDPNTTPELENALDLVDVEELIFDMQNVEYVFSAGLRAFLFFEKTMKAKNGAMRLIHVSDFVKSIFDMVGFQDVIENA